MKEKLSFAIGGRQVILQLPEVSIISLKFHGTDLKLSRFHGEDGKVLDQTPKERGQRARYLDAQGQDCVPVRAFWSSFRQAHYRMTELNGSRFLPAGMIEAELVPLRFRECYLEERRGTKRLVVEPHYRHWSCQLDWEVVGDPEQFLKVCQYAGLNVGVGVGRPERGRGLGRFEFELINSRRAEAA